MAESLWLIDFNPLHHEGGDAISGVTSTIWNDFNPLHHEGGDESGVTDVEHYVHFNPLHHEGGDLWNHLSRYIPLISIHSTTRVETNLTVKPRCPQIFQSTPPRGWRHYLMINLSNIFCISIHSTTRVETGWTYTPNELIQGFQSTPPRGWRPGKSEQGADPSPISIHSTTRVETEITGEIYTTK